MDSLIFALSAIAPIVLFVVLGYFLKRAKLFKKDFSIAINKLVFTVFLPIHLFVSINKLDSFDGIDPSYIFYTLILTVALFLLSIPLTVLTTDRADRRGVILQSCIRSNYALLGISLAEQITGSFGIAVVSLLSAFTIPLFNILGVISLSVFKRDGGKINVKHILLDIVKNPLIIGVALGALSLGVRALLAGVGVDFRLSDVKPVYGVLTQLAGLATPLALMALGARFEVSDTATMKRELIVGTLMRNVIVPLIGIGTAYFIFKDTLSAEYFVAFVAVFATPVAVSTVPMAQEMGGDADLAGQLVVFTTVASALAVFIALFLLRMLGIFA